MKHYLMDLQGRVYFAENGHRVEDIEMVKLMKGDDAAWIGLKISLQTSAQVMGVDILVDMGGWDIKVLGDLNNVFLREEH